jgi:hypothetical protein
MEESGEQCTVVFVIIVTEPGPVFVNLSRSPGIDSQPGGIDS